jgi:hypothetical protein
LIVAEALFFARRGHAVYRVSSAKAADLRRFLRRRRQTFRSAHQYSAESYWAA